MRPTVEHGGDVWVEGPVTRSGLLVDSRSYFRAFYHAAMAARRFLLVTAWELTSTAPLLQGEEARSAPAPVQLLPFLDWLCRRRPRLRVWILCWDYFPIFAHHREWFLPRKFGRAGGGRIHLALDDCPASGGSQHEKYVVVDGRLALLGSADLADGRWDGREHRRCEPLRVDDRGRAYDARHEVQCYFEGPLVAELVGHFAARWCAAGLGTLDLPGGDGAFGARTDASPPVTGTPLFPEAIALPASRLSLSRTRGASWRDRQPSIRELCRLLERAIAGAEKMIYWEVQYFTSVTLARALAARFQEAGRARLEVVLVLPLAAETPAEQLSLAERQAELLRSLEALATAHGHALGIYFSRTADAGDVDPETLGTESGTYIHSKLLLVDDRFLTVGSANATDRSLGLDTELNASWEAGPDDDALQETLCALRVDLLAEHAALTVAEAVALLAPREGLVARLDELAANRRTRLLPHPLRSPRDGAVGQLLVPPGFGFDPDGSLEDLAAREARRPRTLLGRGLSLLEGLHRRRHRRRPGTGAAARGSGGA